MIILNISIQYNVNFMKTLFSETPIVFKCLYNYTSVKTTENVYIKNTPFTQSSYILFK